MSFPIGIGFWQGVDGDLPPDSGNLLLWLDASDSSTVILGAGNDVDAWNDKSGNARNANLSTVAAPQFNTDRIRFTGQALRFATPTNQANRIIGNFINYPDGIDFYVVLQRQGNPSSGAFGYYTYDDIGGSLIGYGHADNRLSFQDAYWGFNNSSGNPADYGSADNLFDTDIHLLNFSYSGDDSPNFLNRDFKVDGVSVAMSDLPNNVSYSEIGGRADRSDLSFNGDLCEILIYDKVLNSNERTELENLLITKWQI